MVICNGRGSTPSRLESLWGGSLLYSTKFLEVPVACFIVEFEHTEWFWTQNSGTGNPAP